MGKDTIKYLALLQMRVKVAVEITIKMLDGVYRIECQTRTPVQFPTQSWKLTEERGKGGLLPEHLIYL